MTLRTLVILSSHDYNWGRFAQIEFNLIAKQWGIPWQAESYAIAETPAKPLKGSCSPEVKKRFQLKLPATSPELVRLPRSFDLTQATSAERIVALSEKVHRPIVQNRFPELLERVLFWNIEEGANAFGQISSAVSGLIAQLLGGTEQGPSEPMAVEPVISNKRKGTVKIGRETKGRKGKGVTLVWEIPLDETGIAELAKDLKAKCGSGGTVKEGVIEIQGEHRDRIAQHLQSLGYQVKRVGG
ncbi:MAG: hypothetical protein N2112_01280 [Gemmataceae bacterium]|nr:hypothetical protein [Gemmataceae bacterium]